MNMYNNRGEVLRTWSKERTNWRDQALSNRHRAWGFNCPAVDLDFVMSEYNHGVPVALIEYKERHAKKPDLSHPSYASMKSLADDRHTPIPFFIAAYCQRTWTFKVFPLNDSAEQKLAPYKDKILSEQQFVEIITRLRKKALDDGDRAAIAQLNDITDPAQ